MDEETIIMTTLLNQPSGSFLAQPKSAPLPPSTAGWPLIGALPALVSQQIDFLPAAQQRYGDIYMLDLGMTKAIVLNHPDHAQHVFRDHARNYEKGGKFWEIIRELLGNGLVVSEGAFWLRQRRMLQPQFHRQRLAALTALMSEAIAEALQSWPTAGKQPLELGKAFADMTMRIITRTMFGGGLEQSEIEQVSAALTYAVNYTMPAMITRSLPTWLFAARERRFQEAVAQIDAVVYKVIERSRAAIQAGDYADNLLSMMLTLVDEESGEGMTDQQMRDETMTIFLAGYETTSVALTWALPLLLHHPEYLQKVQNEIDTVLGGQPVTFSTVGQLSYTRMVLQEVLRLRPPASWLPRVAVEDDEIAGYRIPAGSMVVLPIYMYHHHPAFWEQPTVFDPERFSPERSAGRHAFAWMPFGAGPRLCIGRDFAMLEGQMILATVLQQFTLTALSKEMPLPQLAATLKPRGKVLVQCERRA
jgi:cytochrome P450